MNLFPHGLVFGFLAFFFLIRTFVYIKGRKIVTYMKQKHQNNWEAAKQPQPYYFIPHQKWWLFLKQNKFRDFNDPHLNTLCTKQLKREKTYGVIILITFGGILTLAIWESYF
jgi:hypothetical protein